MAWNLEKPLIDKCQVFYRLFLIQLCSEEKVDVLFTFLEEEIRNTPGPTATCVDIVNKEEGIRPWGNSEEEWEIR